MKRRWRGPLSVAALLGLAITFGVSGARAALTSSEKGQVRDFVAAARITDADKVRSLVARTDLSAEESAAVLSEAVAAVPFTDARGAFLKEVAFGGASAASRAVLVIAEVKAVLARADAVYQRYVGGLDHESRAIQELIAIYAWLDASFANVGAAAGISAATYERCASALGEHINSQPRWLKGDGPLPSSVERLRAQAQIALVDMMPDAMTRRVDAADRLGIGSRARRTMLAHWGLLFVDGGRLDEAKIERVRQLLQRLRGARAGVVVLYVGDDAGGLVRARGGVMQLPAGSEPYPFTGAAVPADYDPATGSIAHDLAVALVRRALRERDELRRQAERDAGAAALGTGRLLGRPRAPTVEHVVGAALFALLTDAPRATELAVARLNDGRSEPVALLSDALGALASFADEEKDAKDRTSRAVEVGQANRWIPAKGIELAANGVALGVVVDGRRWSFERSAPSYQVLGARSEAVPVSTSEPAAPKKP